MDKYMDNINHLSSEGLRSLERVELLHQAEMGKIHIIEKFVEKCFCEFDYNLFCIEAKHNHKKWAELLCFMLDQCEKSNGPIKKLAMYFHQERLLFHTKQGSFINLFDEVEKTIPASTVNKAATRNDRLEFVRMALAIQYVHAKVRTDISQPDTFTEVFSTASGNITTSESGNSDYEVPYLFNIPPQEDNYTFCKAMSNHCYPNDWIVLYRIFFEGQPTVEKKITWTAKDNLFVAYLRYAYMENSSRLPDHIDEIIKKYFVNKEGKEFGVIKNIHPDKIEGKSNTLQWEVLLNSIKAELKNTIEFEQKTEHT